MFHRDIEERLDALEQENELLKGYLGVELLNKYCDPIESSYSLKNKVATIAEHLKIYFKEHDLPIKVIEEV